jgi:hypothetical protein
VLKLFALSIVLSGYILAQNIDAKGDLRVGYQHQKDDDLSIGGGIEVSKSLGENLKANIGFHTTNSLFGLNDSSGIPFFDSKSKSYSILDIANLEFTTRNTCLILGRQDLETPFINGDDVGMVASKYEAYTITNKDFQDIELFASYVKRMSGVDSDEPKRFNSLGDGALALGLGFKENANFWFYDMDSLGKISYLELSRDLQIGGYLYNVAFQGAYEDLDEGEAKIYGLGIEGDFGAVKVRFAYNQNSGIDASNGYGGGAFFTSMEHLTLADIGDDSKAVNIGANLGLDEIIEGASVDLAYAIFSNESSDKSREFDLCFGYEMDKSLSIDCIYSNIDDDINSDSFENIRVFANYQF